MILRMKNPISVDVCPKILVVTYSVVSIILLCDGSREPCYVLCVIGVINK